MSDKPTADSLDTYRFHLKKKDMRVRFENETEDEFDVVIEPRNGSDKE